MKIRRDDNVLVIKGKDKGKKGKIHRVFPDNAKVLVEGVNMIKRHTKARGGVRQAGIIDREAPIHISNIILVCNKCERPTRIGFKLQGGKKLRICRSCNEVID